MMLKYNQYEAVLGKAKQSVLGKILRICMNIMDYDCEPQNFVDKIG